MTDIAIKTPTIPLGAFLKWANVVPTGADAKALIASEDVRVNGEVELRRGRQLRPGDRVRIIGADEEFLVVSA